jgi:soluble lytic murein transglycosylase-like protein
MAYLRWLLGYFNDDLRLALAAYNAGEQTVDKYGGIHPILKRATTCAASLQA